MPLTSEQKTALKADIAANTNVIASGQYAGTQVNAVPNGPDGHFAIAAWYNAKATPDFFIYRTRVPMNEIMLNGFDWTRVDNLSVGKSRIWEWMFDSGGQYIDPSKVNVRAGINAVWVGTQADLNVRAAVYLHCYEAATWSQKLFASGSGTAPDASGSGPGTTALSGMLSYQDVGDAMNS